MKKDNSSKPAYCPFIEEAYEECYASTGMSLDTWKILHFCKSNFNECEIYKKLVFSGVKPQTLEKTGSK